MRWQQLAIKKINSDTSKVTSSVTPTRSLLDRVALNEQEQASVAYRSPRPQRVSWKPGQYTEGTPSGISSEPRTGIDEIAEDEQIVNTALVLLLDGIIMTNPEVAVEATLARKQFHFADLWTARTDGSLRDLDEPERIRAIFEAKACSRNKKEPSIRRQETGEMVCWIFSDRSGSGIMSQSMNDDGQPIYK